MKNISTTQEYKQTEIGVIPADWDIKELGEVGEIKMCRRIFNHETQEVGAIPFYKIGTFGKEADAYIPQELYDNYRRKFSFPKKGEVLISAAGTIGRTIVYDGEPAYFQDSNIVWIDNNEKLISNDYLSYVFKTVKYNTEGGTIQRLYNNIIKSAKFVCPPKPQQTVICSVLADTDKLIKKLEKLIEKKKNIKQGVMQELLTGKKRLPGFSGKWETNKLKDIANYRRGSFPQPYGLEKWYDDDFGLPFVQVVDVDDNFKLKNETKRRISKAGEVFSVFVKKGTIVLTIQGSIGRICITQYDACVDRTLLIFESFREKFDKYFFMLQIFQKFEIEKEKAPGGIIKTITKEALSDFEISYPKDLTEQTAIAAILSDMDTEIEKLESQLIKYQNIKQGMMQTLLTGKIRLLTK